MCKHKRSIKGLKFGDCQNSINYAISTRVIVNDVPSLECLNKFSTSINLQNSMQYDVLLESITESVYQDEDDKNNTDKITEANKVDIDSPANSQHTNALPNSTSETSLENRSDEDVDDNRDQDDSVCINRSGRVSKPYEYSKHFPETGHTQISTTEIRW